MSTVRVITKRAFAFPLLGFLILTGCAHLPPSSSSFEKAPPAVQEASELKGERPPYYLGQPSEIFIRGVQLKNTKFDIPIAINSRVEAWVDYFCGRGRAFFRTYLERSRLFIPYIVPLLKQNGLPEDLVYLAMIESGFNNLARSRARAVGPWQFISATGKRYGLAVNWWVDERRDIRKSTLAAVEYLRDLYTIFQSWELAAAAYNAGEAKIARAVRRYGTKDFWLISKHQFLRRETRDYVPKIIAAALIAKNRALFGFEEESLLPGAGEVVAGDGEVVQLEKADQPLPNDGNPVKAVSLVTADDLDAPLTKMDVSLPKPVTTPHVTRKGELGGEELMSFEVQSPADLLKIARASGLSYTTVKALNPEVLRWCTPPHLGSYQIKLPVSVKERFLSTYNHEAFPRQVQFMTYKVRTGETLSRIARHFGIKVDPISELNRIHPRARLIRGSHVLLPIPNDRSRSFSSLDLRDPSPRRHRVRHHRHKRYYNINFKQRAENSRSVGFKRSSRVSLNQG